MLWFLGAVVLLYALGLNEHWRFQRDSALYLSLGRSLAENGTYEFNFRPHSLALPGFPGLLYVVYAMVGESFLAMNLLVSLLGIGCVATGWLLYRKLGLSGRALIACCLLLGLSRTLYYYSTHVMADVPFLLLALVGLYLGLRMLEVEGAFGWTLVLATGLTAAAAATLRPLGPALLAGLVGGLWLRRGSLADWLRNSVRTLVVIAPSAALAAVIVLQEPDGRTYYTVYLAGRSPAALMAGALSKAPELMESLSDALLGTNVGLTAGTLLTALMLLGLVTAARKGERMVSIYGALCVVGTLVGNPGRRSLLPALPALILWLVLGAGRAGDLLERLPHLSRRRLVRLSYVLLGVALAVNLIRIGEVIREARSSDFYQATEHGRLAGYFDLTEWLESNAPPGATVLTREHRFVHYFARTRVVPFRRERVGDSAYRLKSVICEHAVTHVVHDSREQGDWEWLGAVIEGNPRIWEQVRRFGTVTLYRVHRDRLDTLQTPAAPSSGSGTALRGPSGPC
ncbi:MAG: hypothetical protein PVJ27_08310 [Candidatus Brocadiaceae bacterium]